MALGQRVSPHTLHSVGRPLTMYQSAGRKDGEPPKDQAPRMGAGPRSGVENNHGPTQPWVFVDTQEDSAGWSATQVNWLPSLPMPGRDSPELS